MERTTGRQLLTYFTFKREVKIGVSVNVEQRRAQVDSGIDGEIIILEKYAVKNAFKVESELHAKYINANLNINDAKSGSGSTEFFRLSNSEIRSIKKHLRKESGTKKGVDFIEVIFYFVIILFIYFVL